MSDPVYVELAAIGHIVTNREELESVVNALTDTELVELWRKLWKESCKKFCRVYDLDPSNFSRFRRGKKKNARAVLAMQKFLLGFDTIPARTPFAEPDMHKLISNLERYNYILFVDGDNLLNVKTFAQMNFPDDIHVIIFMSSRRNSSVAIELPEGMENRITWIQANTSIKNATDFQFVFHVASLNILAGPHIEFALVSSDRFINEISPGLAGRSVVRLASVETFLEYVLGKNVIK